MSSMTDKQVGAEVAAKGIDISKNGSALTVANKGKAKRVVTLHDTTFLAFGVFDKEIQPGGEQTAQLEQDHEYLLSVDLGRGRIARGTFLGNPGDLSISWGSLARE